MTSPEKAFAVETGAGCERALEALEGAFRVAREKLAGPVATYYDTFDWRLVAAGGTLSAAPAGREVEIRWQSARGAVRRTLPALPAFVWELPPGGLRDRLTPILEMRRLLPVVEVRRRGWLLRILNKDEKTVVRLRLEEAAARPPGSRAAHPVSPAALAVLPVKGYGKAHRKVLRLIEEELGLEPLAGSELERALAAIGRAPGDYSSKIKVRLDPAERADEALKVILRDLLATLLANEEGTRQDLDSEFLHDFRVAVRRTRSALSQVKGVLPPDDVEPFRRELSWLGGATGPTRDLDVYLLKMPDYEASLPPSVRDDLKPLKAFLERHQRLEQRRLAKALGSPRYARLVRGWSAFLEQPPPAEPPPHAARPIAEVASERIWKTWRKVAKAGRAIDPDTPAEALHRLRIACKKLRYLLEFFRSLYPEKKIGPLVKSLKQLQDNLGDFNDYEVQQGALAEFGRQMRDEGDTPVATLMAMGRLVDHLESGQAEERRKFAERFARFDSRDNRRLFRRLFAPEASDP